MLNWPDRSSDQGKQGHQVAAKVRKKFSAVDNDDAVAT
jgi:hypothetical protein